MILDFLLAMLSLLSLFSLLLSAAIIFIFWSNLPSAIWQYYRQCKHLRSFPAWPCHWLWGHLHLVNADEATMMRYMDFMRERKPKMTCFWVGPFFASVGIHHPNYLKLLLKEEKSRPIYRVLMPWLGEGLLIAEGKRWARNRRLLTPAFHFEILKGYVPVYNKCVGKLLEKWRAKAKEGISVKIFDTVSLLSLDIISQCAFSYKSDCQNTKLEHPYVKAVYDLSFLVTDRFLNPIYHIDWLYALTSAGRRSKQACKLVHDHSMKVINERRNILNEDQLPSDTRTQNNELKTRKYLDFLDILLTATDEDGTGLSDTEIRAEVDTFMFEGHDTTTSGMCWTLYCLAKHPEHQQKVRDEIRAVLQGRDYPDYDDLKELKYTQWCIKEAMRLYPPVPEFYRKVSEDVKLDGYVIPKGTQFSVQVYALHHNPELWEDPETFDPLRFHPSNAEKRDPYAYIPFSAGHRNCIGQNFALNEQKVVVGSIVNSFQLTLDKANKVEMSPRVVLRSKYDIILQLEEIN